MDIQEAVDLRYMLYLRQHDRVFTGGMGTGTKQAPEETRRGRIIYALDSNLLYEYFSVLRSRRQSVQDRPSFRIFTGPKDTAHDSDTEAEFGAVVKQYVLSKLSPDRPLLLLPGHAEEAKGVFDNVSRGFDAQGNRSRTARKVIESYLAALSKASGPEERLAVASKWRDRIRGVLYSLNDPHDKFLEFSRLLAHKRLLGLTVAAALPEFSEFTRASSGEHIFLCNDVIETDWEGSADWWEGKLNSFLPRRYLDQDKRALSALDRINRLLRPHDTKIVLLTKNTQIIDAGRRYRPYKYARSDVRELTFSDLYLRNPKYLLSEPDLILDSDADGKSDLTGSGAAPTDWLDTFLAHSTGNGHTDVVSFRRAIDRHSGEDGGFGALALKLVSGKPRLHTELMAAWIAFLEQVNLSHGTSSRLAVDRMIERFGDLEASQEELLDELDEHIHLRTEESWNNFFLLAVQSGFQLVDLAADTASAPRRAVPPIVFRGMGNAPAYIELLSEEQGIVRNREKILEFLAELSRSTEGNDPTVYIRAMCYALLFAHADRWPVATLVALRAAKIARNLERRSSGTGFFDPTFGRVTGREAYYLAAVGSRLTSNNAADLEAARRNLQRAVEAQTLEMQDGDGDPNSAHVPLTGLRFASESVAIEVSEMLYTHLATARHYGKKNKKKEISFVSSCRRLLVAISKALDESEACQDEFVRAATRIALRGNYFTVLMLLELTGPLPQADLRPVPRMIATQVKDFQRVYPAGQGRLRLSVIDTYLFSYGASLVGELNEALPGLSAMLKRVSQLDKDRDRLIMMPYDRLRFSTILDFVERHEKTRPMG